MKCPSCGHEQSRTVDSRTSYGTKMRRRECVSCKHRWSTRETVVRATTPRSRHLAAMRRSVKALLRSIEELKDL